MSLAAEGIEAAGGRAGGNFLLSRWRLAFWLTVLWLVAAVLLHFGVNFALRRAAAAAEEDVGAKVELDADAVGEALNRDLEGCDLIFDLLRDLRRARAGENPAAAAGLEYLLKQGASSERFGIFGAYLVDQHGEVTWNSDEAAVGHPLPLSHWPGDVSNLDRDVGLYVRPLALHAFYGRTGIVFSRRVSLGDGSPGGLAVLVVDPAALKRQFLAIRRNSRRHIGLWRERGELLVGSDVDPETSAKASTGFRPAAWPHGVTRSAGPISGEDTFREVRALPGTPLYYSVSRLAASELAGYNAAARLARWCEALLLLVLGGMTATVWEINERRLATIGNAERQEAELRRVLDGVQALIALNRVGPERKSERSFLNTGCERIMRLPRAQLMAEGGDIVQRLMAGDEVSFELRIRRGDGSLRWMRFGCHAIGRIPGGAEVVTLVTDIENEKASAAAAISASRMATLGELAANLSHQLAQPLAIMSLSAERALEHLPPQGLDPVRKRLTRIVETCEQTSRLMDGLRRLAHRDESALGPVALSAVLDSVRLLTADTLKSAGIDLACVLPDSMPLVWGDEQLIGQVLMNLLLNARDALEGLPRERRGVTLSCDVGAEIVTLTLADHGPGIPAEILPQLFEPFFTTKPAGKGTGLGLSLCAGIVQSCGGSIQAVNRPEGGAAFIVALRRSFAGATSIEASAEPAAPVPETL